MNTIKIYLSGASEIYEDAKKAREWREEIKKWFHIYCENVRVVSPMDYYGYSSSNHKTDREVFRFDLHMVRTSDLVMVNLEEIRKSAESCIEVYEAYRSSIPVIGFYNDKITSGAMKNAFHPWVYECIDRIEAGEDAMESAMMYIKDFYVLLSSNKDTR